MSNISIDGKQGNNLDSMKDQTTPTTIDLSSLDNKYDTISDTTKKVVDDDASITEEKKIAKSYTEDSIIEESASPPQKPSSLNLFRNLNSLEQDPRQFSPIKKRMILATVALATSISPISSTIFLPAIVPMQEYFNCSPTTINSALSAFVFANAIFPLFWAPTGEQFGRRKLYLISFLISAVGSLICAESVNVGMFIAFRFISAAGSSSVMSMGAGTLADIYDAHERGRAMALYTSGPLLGPAIGPIVGGYLNKAFGWRSAFYFVAAYGLFIWFLILFFLPETWRPLPSSLPDAKEKPLTTIEKFKKVDPYGGLRFFKNINIVLTVAFSGVSFMMFYMLNTTFSRTYTVQYGLDSGTVGLCYLPLAAGGLVGSNIAGRIADRVYNKRVAAANGDVYPEMRLSLEVIALGVFLQISAMIAYGWCIYFNVHMAGGLVCIFFVAAGIMIPLVTLSTYAVDCFRRQSASVSAFNNLIRYIMAGIGSLVATDAENAMGSGALYSMCAGFTAVFFVLVIYVQKNPDKWR